MTAAVLEILDLPSLDTVIPCDWVEHSEPPPAEWRVYLKPWCLHIPPTIFYCQGCMEEMLTLDIFICRICRCSVLAKRHLLRMECL